MDLRFRHLAGATTALTFGLILLGVYTGAVGAGLACAARWPFCDGWMGLFPANVRSFVEWSHRLVAMVTGFFVLGTTAAAWRGDHGRHVRYATAVALAVLPVQILLGANTIFNFGVLAQVLHHGAALLIFGSLVAATAWAVGESGPDSPAGTDDAGTDTAGTDTAVGNAPEAGD